MKLKVKKCSRCKVEKPINEFFTSSTQSDGFQAYCKQCNRTSARKWYQGCNKKTQALNSRRYNLKSKYNLTLEEYDQILKNQGGVCAICQKPETQCSYKGIVDSLRVDHCHSTNMVRGLLCSKCNFGISQFNDKLGLLFSATRYILKFKHKLEGLNEH